MVVALRLTSVLGIWGQFYSQITHTPGMFHGLQLLTSVSEPKYTRHQHPSRLEIFPASLPV